MNDWAAKWEGRACSRCGLRSNLLRIYVWRPPIDREGRGRLEARLFVKARCLDRRACEARDSKRRLRASLRGSRIDVVLPPGAEAERRKPGHCGWCGEPMWRMNKDGERVLDKTRSYHRAERGERGCRDEVDHSHCFRADSALRMQAKVEGHDLRCADCGTLCMRLTEHGLESVGTWWEADHELALEDGGEHTLENLRCRCQPCHARKTARENAARRGPAVPSGQLTIDP